jgi:hypothetical protein
MLQTIFFSMILAGALAGRAMAQAPDTGCALPSEPRAFRPRLMRQSPGPAEKDRACMKALLIPGARMIFVSIATGGAPIDRIETSDAGPAMAGEFL